MTKQIENKVFFRVMRHLSQVFAFASLKTPSIPKEEKPVFLTNEPVKFSKNIGRRNKKTEEALEHLLNFEIDGESILSWLRTSCGIPFVPSCSVHIESRNKSKRVLKRNGIRKSCTLKGGSKKRQRFLVINTELLPQSCEESFISHLRAKGEEYQWISYPYDKGTTFRLDLKYHPALIQLGEDAYEKWDEVRSKSIANFSKYEKKSWIQENRCWFL